MYPNVYRTTQLRKVTLLLCLFGIVLLTNGRKQGKWIPSYAGRYRVLVRRVGNETQDYNCTGDGWGRLHASQVRGRQPQYGWGWAYSRISLTDDMKIEITMASRSNNQWKKNAFIFKFDRACSSAKLHFPSVLKLIYGQDFDCPIPAIGLRERKNETFEIIFPKFPVMPFGRYLFTLAFMKDKICHTIYVADGDIVPKLTNLLDN